MSKYILIPDSFKGTMSSPEICTIIKEQILKLEPNATVISIPVADGGEGSVDSFLDAKGGRKVNTTVCGPFRGEKAEAFYGLIDGGKTAIVEMAACAGLPMVDGRADPKRATTYGVGELILAAAQSGAKRIIVGLGGSATNDGGCGAAAAAGFRFLDKSGGAFIPAGGTLKDIDRIEGGRSTLLDGVEVTAMCDIDNPLYGLTGAAHIFGPQKGASPEVVEELDAGLRHLAELIKRDLGVDVSALPGAGAAGGLGAGMAAFFGAPLRMGIETVLDAVGFEDAIKDADVIFTGEGKIDAQSLRGKVVIGVARRAKPIGIPVIAVVGAIDGDMEAAYDEGVTAIASINPKPEDFSAAKDRCRENLAGTVSNIIRLWQAARKGR